MKNTQNGSAKVPLNDLLQKHFADRDRIMILSNGSLHFTTRYGRADVIEIKPSSEAVVAQLEQNLDTGQWSVVYADWVQDYTSLPELLDEDIALLKLGADFRTTLNNRNMQMIAQKEAVVQKNHPETVDTL